MLACYYLQGKQLASGVIGLLTCQSHYNVSGINTTPCARLLLRHPLAQRIPTEPCERSVRILWGSTAHPTPCLLIAFVWLYLAMWGTAHRLGHHTTHTQTNTHTHTYLCLYTHTHTLIPFNPPPPHTHH